MSHKSCQKINDQQRRNENELILIYLICDLSGYLTSFNGQKSKCIELLGRHHESNILQFKYNALSNKKCFIEHIENVLIIKKSRKSKLHKFEIYVDINNSEKFKR